MDEGGESGESGHGNPLLPDGEEVRLGAGPESEPAPTESPPDNRGAGSDSSPPAVVVYSANGWRSGTGQELGSAGDMSGSGDSGDPAQNCADEADNDVPMEKENSTVDAAPKALHSQHSEQSREALTRADSGLRMRRMNTNSSGNHQKHVQILESLEIHEASDTNSESDRVADSDNERQQGHPITPRNRTRKELPSPTVGKREIVGILKPPNPIKEMKSFPSLPDSFLHHLGLLEDMTVSAEHLSEQDIENKFSSLSLAFKTDRVTLADRLELQQRQRDLAERNVADEIRQLKITLKSLNRVCQDSETREILERVCKQVTVLQQSSSRVASSSEQFGAVQQEMRVSTAVEIMLLHLENLKRSYEREHTELEETKRILVQHKIIEGEPSDTGREVTTVRNRSISVMHGSSIPESTKVRRASAQVSSGRNLGLDIPQSTSRPKSPTLFQLVSTRNQNSPLIKEDLAKNRTEKIIQKMFKPIAEYGEDDSKNDTNNNTYSENKNSSRGPTTTSSSRGPTTTNSCRGPTTSTSSSTSNTITNSGCIYERRKESRRQSHFDVDTIIEEIDELALRRDSTNSNPPPLPTPPRPVILPTSARELMQRKKSLLLHIHDWYSDLSWPYDEEETVQGVRYLLSAILSVTAFAILVGTFLK